MVISIDPNLLIQTTIANFLSNLSSSLFWIILFFWGITKISKEIKSLAKDIPNWIEKYFQLRHQQLRVESAISGKTTGVPLNLDKRKIIPLKTK